MLILTKLVLLFLKSLLNELLIYSWNNSNSVFKTKFKKKNIQQLKFSSPEHVSVTKNTDSAH